MKKARPAFEDAPANSFVPEISPLFPVLFYYTTAHTSCMPPVDMTPISKDAIPILPFYSTSILRTWDLAPADTGNLRI